MSVSLKEKKERQYSYERSLDIENVEPMISTDKEDVTKITLPSINRGLFQGFAPRRSLLGYEETMSSSKTHRFAEHMDLTRSTATDLEQWLRHAQSRQMSKSNRLKSTLPSIHNRISRHFRRMTLHGHGADRDGTRHCRGAQWSSMGLSQHAAVYAP